MFSLGFTSFLQYHIFVGYNPSFENLVKIVGLCNGNIKKIAR